jgi:hypothetical protein
LVLASPINSRGTVQDKHAVKKHGKALRWAIETAGILPFGERYSSIKKMEAVKTASATLDDFN